jgi:uncharacterized protein YyaL (SSP411 family)
MNRLAASTSPYLRQHADNPVDWHQWGDEAFAEAEQRDVPVLLSVGYSACHWCHVMAHESFEDPEVAAVMNRLFVNVKVDREERPDVDAIYMEAVQAMAGQGGWPMTVFLTPKGEPFFGGTYFPPRASHGRPGFVELMEAIDEAWRARRNEVTEQGARLTAAIRERAQPHVAAPGAGPEIGPEVQETAVAGLMQAFDPQWGGFGTAPKFPQPSFSELLLHRWSADRNPGYLAAVSRTAAGMAAGGIYDHLGGGFSRYSVDPTWTVPHFEKMLYDQAGLIRLYTRLWRADADPAWAQVVEETIEYTLRDLSHPEGGICAAEDADSEGVEGKFYVWSLEEVERFGGAAAVEWYGVTAAGNFEGANILRRPVGQGLARPPEIDEARQRLLAERSRRVRPGLDDKVLTEWNAMFLAALAEAAFTFARPDWRAAALDLATALPVRLRRADGRWLRSAGAAHLAVAADYAWLVDAYTRLAETTGDGQWLTEATAVAEGLVALFWDDRAGGFLTVGRDGEQLISDPRDTHDGASPSANSVAAVALARLSALTADSRWRERAEQTVASLATQAQAHPAAVTNLLIAADLLAHGVVEVVVPGPTGDLLEVMRSGWHPRTVLAHGKGWESPLWEGRERGLAYVCQEGACLAPAATRPDLEAALAGAGG